MCVLFVEAESQIKTEKFEDDGESLDAIVIKDEPDDVDIKFETFPAMPSGPPFQPGQPYGQPIGAFSSHSQSPGFSQGHPGTISTLGTGTPPQWTPGTPGSQPPSAALGTPDASGSVSVFL